MDIVGDNGQLQPLLAQWSNLSHCQTHNGAGNSQSGTVLKPLRCLAKIINKYSGELAQMQTWKKFFCFHDPIGELRKFLQCFRKVVKNWFWLDWFKYGYFWIGLDSLEKVYIGWVWMFDNRF